MKNITRTVRKNAKVLGLLKGVQKNLELLSYIDARNLIYLPCYNFVLKRYLEDEIQNGQSINRRVIIEGGCRRFSIKKIRSKFMIRFVELPNGQKRTLNNREFAV
ncbi:hypothetical protein V2550_05025 [Tenacibaculum maritimum]